MKQLVAFAILITAVCFAHADSVLPFEGVPDLQKDESAKVFGLPVTKQPLRFYIDHMPKLLMRKGVNRSKSYEWKKISGYHASFRFIGYVYGRRVYVVRYVNGERIAEGDDSADTLILLAKGFNSYRDFEVIYFTYLGLPYNTRAEYVANGHTYGAVRLVTQSTRKSSGFKRSVHIRGTKDRGFERFIPEMDKAEQAADGDAE